MPLPLPQQVGGPTGRAWYAVARRRARWRATADRAALRNDAFSVICSNCWGAEIYRHLGLPYTTPFVGLFLEPACYLKVVSDLRGYLTAPLTFIETSRYEHLNALRRTGRRPTVPIGLLRGDAEIQFLHYASEEEAAEKWTRRAQRVNWDDLRVSFVEFGPGAATIVPAFDALDGFAAKVVLTPESRPGIASALQVRGDFSNAAALYYQTLNQFDVVRWLNDGTVDRRRAARSAVG